jgi:hypothetical protein
MFSTDTPWESESVVIALGVMVAVSWMLVRIWRRIVRDYPVPPDPWSWKVDRLVRSRWARPVCTNYLFPQNNHNWICPHCGFPTGEYVTVMPYFHIFAIGEALRRGVIGPPDRSVARFLGFMLFAVIQYSTFAQVYWFWMVRKACGRPIVDARRPVIEFEQSE